MSHHLYDYYMLKKSGRYFGYTNYTTNPVVFAFTKQKNIETVRNNLCCYSKYRIDNDISSVYKVTFEQPLETKQKFKSSSIEIERMGYFDMNLHVTINNVDCFIVDDIIEDDDTNMYLVNCGTAIKPVFVNDSMVKKHLDRFINVEKINEDP